MSDGLHDKITQRLAELRAVAKAATNESGHWRWEHGFGDMCNDAECPYGMLLDEQDPGSPASATVIMQVHGFDVKEPWQGAPHIAAWSPAHSLRWIEWAEDVAREHTLSAADQDNYGTDGCAECGPFTDWPCKDISRLAGALDIEVTP